MYFFDPDYTYVSDTSTLLGHKTRNILMSFFCFFNGNNFHIIYIYISIKFSQLEQRPPKKHRFNNNNKKGFFPILPEKKSKEKISTLKLAWE